jgi:hypothetical protein
VSQLLTVIRLLLLRYLVGLLGECCLLTVTLLLQILYYDIMNLYYHILLSLDVSHGVLVNLAEPRLSFDASHGVLVNLAQPGRF